MEQQIEFYGYFLNHKKCKIVQYKCIGEKVSNSDKYYRTRFYYADTGKYTNSQRLVHLDTFEQVKSFRILSFNDDYEHYKQIILDAYTKMIADSKAKIEKQEKFLEMLKPKVSKIN